MRSDTDGVISVADADDVTTEEEADEPHVAALTAINKMNNNVKQAYTMKAD